MYWYTKYSQNIVLNKTTVSLHEIYKQGHHPLPMTLLMILQLDILPLYSYENVTCLIFDYMIGNISNH